MYHPLFYNDWRLITIGVICLIIILSGLIVCVFHAKIPFVKKWFTTNRMITLMFVLAMIIGLSVAGANHFKIFDQNNKNDLWIERLIYLIASIINWCVTIMFIGFIVILPFRYILTIFTFTKFRNPKLKIIKVSSMYLFFGALALAVCTIGYGVKDSFLNFASPFSNHPLPLTWDNYPTLFYVSNFLLIKGFQIRGTSFGFILLLSLAAIIIVEYILIKILATYKYKWLLKLIKISNIISNKTISLTLIAPVFTFSSMLTSLMVQTGATFLRISFVFMIIIILCAIIYIINLGYSMSTKSLSFKGFNQAMKQAAKIIIKNPVSQSVFDEIKKHQTFRGFKDFNKEQDTYDIFLTTIFPLVIVGYLGFSAGPLLDNDFPFYGHLYFWIMIYLLGYVLMFAYAFKYTDVIPTKIVLSNAAPYIRSGFNNGILNFFNKFINKLSLYATFSTYLAIACKHDKHYKKPITNH